MLAQLAQVGTDCNTNSVPEKVTKKERKWCFTWNNYDRNGLAQLAQDFENNYEKGFIKKYCFQEENEGTPHIQGCVWFKNAVRFATVKKIGPSFHWEVCRKDFDASVNYCSKKEKRKGQLYTKGCTIMKKNEYEKEISWKEMLDNMKDQFMEEDIKETKKFETYMEDFCWIHDC